jgi:hypothetical protein
MEVAMKYLSGRKLSITMLITIFILSVIALVPRWDTEMNNRSAAIVMDHQDLVWIADQSNASLDTVREEYVPRGLAAIMVRELTGEDLEKGMLPVQYSSLSSSGFSSLFGAGEGGRALLRIPAEWWALERADEYLRTKMKGIKKIELSEYILYLLPGSCSDLGSSGIIPDFDGLEFAQRSGLPIIYRPAPSPGMEENRITAALEMVLDGFSGIKGLSPSGEVVASYPKLNGLAEIIRKRDLALAQVEFSRQIGAVKLNWLSYPNILPLHSVTDEEILSRRISRTVLFERMLRAARERSVRLLVMRPSRFSSADSLLEDFGNELSMLKEALETNGISSSWPGHGIDGRKLLPGLLAFVLLLIFLFYSMKERFCDGGKDPGPKEIVAILVMIPLLSVAILKVSIFTRLAGAFAAGFLAAEASFVALEGWKRPVRAILSGFIVAVAGGLAIAAFFSSPFYMLRLKSFSGVKITLLLPILLVLFHDLKRRVHPESLGQILQRPPLWGELFLLGFLLLGAALVLFRSGNVQLVPGWEVKIRDMLERLLIARPRNKEIFAGYPALALWFLFRKKDIWPHYREVFRLGATLAFSSVVNSFCHFHTRLYFILLREFNGLWTGMITGMAVVLLFALVLLPMWKQYRGAVLD